MNRTLLALLCIAAASAWGDTNGSIEHIGDIRILNLWGSWEEMGYAHGYLLGPDISDVFHDYFLEMAGGVGNFQNAKLFFMAYFEVPEDFEDYTQGMIAGIADTISLYSPDLGRDIDYIDICVCSAIPDIAALKMEKDLLCSSVSAWGDATVNDTYLNGAPAISRNLDYYVDTGGTILNNSILITFDPSEGQEWVSVGFPGFAGSLSGMNESGISSCLNMGNNQGTSQYSSPFVPICMALALGLSENDFNGSGQCDVEDMIDALTNWNWGNSYDIHVVADRNLAGQDSCAVVVEISNKDGHALRYSSDEPTIAPERMILTNHHRVLIPPVYCYRYSYMMDSLTTNPEVNLQRFWNFMGAVGWPASPGSGGTLQTMIFMPEILGITVSFSTASTPSYSQVPQDIAWDDIFPNHSSQGLEDMESGNDELVLFPNPSTGSVRVVVSSPDCEVAVYDLSGRCLLVGAQHTDDTVTLDLSELPGGIYRIIVTSNATSSSREVVILR